MMRASGLAVMVLLAGCAAGSSEYGRGYRDGRDGLPLRLKADPSRVVAAEIAFARSAQEEGQWTAFAEFAAEDATLFVPQAVNAQEWLDDRPNPPEAVRWQVHEVWSSCDGSLAVTRGAAQWPDGSPGWFTTVWQRQRNGSYRWVLDQGGRQAEPLAAPEMIASAVADCSPPVDEMAADLGGATAGGRPLSGAARDNTLEWSASIAPDHSRQFVVHLWLDGEKREVLRTEVAAPPAG